MELTLTQRDLIDQVHHSKVFLRGPFGSGKTTTGTRLLDAWVREKSANHSIIILAPQRGQHLAYQKTLHQNSDYHGQPVSFLTMHSLARRMITLYWPLINDFAGFTHPDQPPSYLTMESAQYFMAHLVSPLIDQGYFSSLTMDRNRIYSQLLDNLNKSAISGFPSQNIGERLSRAWIGDSSQLNIYEDVQNCINLFRTFCLENNLLDYSLQIELFQKFIWPSKLFRSKLFSSFQNMIYENCEEDPPFVHELVKEWLPQLNSALLILDEGAGFRHFLGANPISAASLAEACDKQVTFSTSFVTSPSMQAIIQHIQQPKADHKNKLAENSGILPDTRDILISPEEELRFYPQMLGWVVDKVRQLVDSGTSPGEIAILSPFVSDMLRFEIESRLEDYNIPHQSYRPSRALRDEPAIQALLTLIKLKNTSWQFSVTKLMLTNTLTTLIQDLDPIRARLLAEKQPSPNDQHISLLLPFSEFDESTRNRITYRLGARYQQLVDWLSTADATEPLDLFISRIFGELLSQPGFTFYQDVKMGQLTANLVESIAKFRWALDGPKILNGTDLSKEYIKMVSEGVIAAHYIQDWQQEQFTNAVYLSPAYSFLLHNRAVNYQFWLDINNNGWYARLLQPLTHPYVLSQDWQPNDKWDADDEMKVGNENLERVISGLLRRCRKSVYLGTSSLNQSGSDERGLLTRKIFEILRQSIKAEKDA